MTVQTLMSPSPVTLRASDTLEHGVAALLQQRATALPVTDANGSYLGFLTMRQVLGLLIPKAATMEGGLTDLAYVHETLTDVRERFDALRGRTIGEFIDTAVPVVKKDTSIPEALWLLYHEHRCTLPVVEDENNRKLLGLVTAWETLAAAAEKK